MDWHIELIDSKPFLCFTFTNQTLKVLYNNKEVIERMTKTYFPSKEEMILARPHLVEVL